MALVPIKPVPPAQRASATKAGFDAGHAQKFGDLDKALGDNGKRLFDWSRDQVAEIPK